MIAPGSLFCSTLMAIQNKMYTVGLFYSLNARETFATRNVTMDFTGNVSYNRHVAAQADEPALPAARGEQGPHGGDGARRRRDGDVRNGELQTKFMN